MQERNNRYYYTMDLKELDKIARQISLNLEWGRLHDALKRLLDLAEGSMYFELGDRIKRLRQTYGYMLRYLTEGANDPDRDRLLRNLIAETYELLDEYMVFVEQKDKSSLYYDQRRFNARNYRTSALNAAISEWKDALSSHRSMSSLYTDASSNSSQTALKFENAEKTLFNAVWTSFPMSKTDAQALKEIINRDDSSFVSSVRLTGALYLALMERFDEEAFLLLCDVYEYFCDSQSEGRRSVSAMALVSLVLVLHHYRKRTFSSAVMARFDALKENKRWKSDIKTAFLELVRTRDTERINRKMYDEIIPDMMAMKPEMEKKLKNLDIDLSDPEAIENNPDWEEMLENSPLAEKLKELNELQMEGSDLYMGSFSSLKNFPFYNDIVNWFTPFSAQSYAIQSMLDSDDRINGLYDLARDLPYLCDNDKYSMLFSIKMVPGDKLDLMLNNLMANREHLEEIRNHTQGVTDKDQRKNDITNVVRNLYRFVNLFRRKGEFHNNFSHSINLLEVECLRDELQDVDTLHLIGEFYFGHGYYRESLTAFKELDKMGEFDSTLYQKMGYAYLKMGLNEDALRFFEQADLLDSTSKWLKMRLATTYRLVDRRYDAIQMLNRMKEEYPDDDEISFQLGYTYILDENYREALKHLYKVEFNKPDSARVLRPIAWALMMIKDFDKSLDYYNKIISIGVKAEDYLNMGHIALARRNYKEAINYYKLYIATGLYNADRLFGALNDDKKNLVRIGVDEKEISLIADALLYQTE